MGYTANAFRAATATLIAAGVASCTSTGSGPGVNLCSHSSSEFTETYSISVPSEFEDASLATGDLTGNGETDLVLAAPTGKVMIVSLSDSSATVVQPPTSVGTTGAGTALAFSGVVLMDLDGDGRNEIILLSRNTDELLVVDARNLAVRQRMTVPSSPSLPVRADVDADGHDDLVIAGSNAGIVTILSAVNGSLTVRSAVAVVGPINRLAIEDIDGDGYPELLVSSFDAVAGHGWLRIYPAVFSLGAAGLPLWSGYNGTPSRVQPSVDVRFASTASSFAHQPVKQLVAADQGHLQVWDPNAIAPPSAALNFEARELLTLDVDGDFRQDIFASSYPAPLDSSGHALLGAISFNEGTSLSGPQPIQVGFSTRSVAPVVLFRKNWALGLAAIGVSSSGKVDLHVLEDLCAKPSEIRIAQAGPGTQLVQSRSGTVPLFSGKTTAVPVVLASRYEVWNVGLRASLLDAQGAVLTDLPVAAPRASSHLRPGADGATFYVIVPKDLVTAGTLNVQVQLIPPIPSADTDSTNNTSIAALDIRPSKTLTYALVNWRYNVCAASDVLPPPQSTCRSGAMLTRLDPVPQEDIDYAVGELTQALPSGAVTFPVVDLVDSNPAVTSALNDFSIPKFVAAAPAARALFDQQNPSMVGTPIYLMVHGAPGVGLLTMGEPTGVGDVLVIVHETGHMAGSHHVQCGNTMVDDADKSYPYVNGEIGGPASDPDEFSGLSIRLDSVTGTWQVIRLGPTTCDVMSYASPRWPSDWTYSTLQNGVNAWGH